MSVLDFFDSPLTRQGLDLALGMIPPPWGILVAGAVKGGPVAAKYIAKLVGGETVTQADLLADWPAIQAEAKRVGADWDASEAEKLPPA